MNTQLKKIAEKEAERLYLLTDSKEFNAHIEVLRMAFTDGFQSCFNHLAGSKDKETMKNEVSKIINNFLKDKEVRIETGEFDADETYKNYLKPSDVREAFELLFTETYNRVFTASAVAKAVGEKWVKVSDGGFENDVEYLCKDNRGNFHYVAKRTEDGWRVFQDITCSPEYYQPITPTTH